MAFRLITTYGNAFGFFNPQKWWKINCSFNMIKIQLSQGAAFEGTLFYRYASVSTSFSFFPLEIFDEFKQTF